MTKTYTVSYLPLFEQELQDTSDYISHKLRNPQAAARLVDAVEGAIMDRLPFAESFEPYRSAKERRYPYYRIDVGNYAIYYVVIDTVMEVRRLLYKGRNRAALL
ncbi:MAG: type II toxin-antitoxin system RelE/ParE family toxin [Coriobacteriia bacterium]|nr:type II toxin-antitoxin system RelE/ParE family toxin [Coriobacteriia bacterium]